MSSGDVAPGARFLVGGILECPRTIGATKLCVKVPVRKAGILQRPRRALIRNFSQSLCAGSELVPPTALQLCCCRVRVRRRTRQPLVRVRLAGSLFLCNDEGVELGLAFLLSGHQLPGRLDTELLGPEAGVVAFHAVVGVRELNRCSSKRGQDDGDTQEPGKAPLSLTLCTLYIPYALEVPIEFWRLDRSYPEPC